MVNTLLCIMLIIANVIFIFLQKKNNCPALSIVQLQNYVWLFAFALYASGFFKYFEFEMDVFIYSFFYLLFFNIGSFGRHYSLKEMLREANGSEELKAIICEPKRVRKCIIGSIVAWLFSIPVLQKSIPILSSNSLSIGMNILRNSTYSEYSIFTTSEQILMNYIIRPVFTISIILLAEQIAIRKCNWKLMIVAIIDAFMLVLMTAGRAMLVTLVLYVSIAIILINGINIIKIVHRYKRYVIPAIFLLVVILNVVTQRIHRDNGAVKEFIIYYFSGIPYFSAMLKNKAISPFTTYGSATFAFVFDAIFLVLRNIGINIPLASQTISHLTTTVINVAPNIATNATASTLLAFYLDFGTFGMIISGTFLGYFTRRYECKTVLNFSCLSFSRYLFLVVGIISSIQNYAFGNITTLMTWVLMGLLLR